MPQDSAGSDATAVLVSLSFGIVRFAGHAGDAPQLVAHVTMRNPLTPMGDGVAPSPAFTATGSPTKELACPTDL